MPWSEMNMVTVGDTCYFMGGYIGGWATFKAYTACPCPRW